MGRRLGWRGSQDAAKQADVAYQAWRMKVKERAWLREREVAEMNRMAKLGLGKMLEWVIRELEKAVDERDAERVRRIADWSKRAAGGRLWGKVAIWAAEAARQIRAAECLS